LPPHGTRQAHRYVRSDAPFLFFFRNTGMDLQRKALTATQFTISPETNAFKAYFAVFGNVDKANELIVKGAFTPYLEDFKRSGWIDWNHSWESTVATITDAAEDEIGLLVTGNFHSTEEAQKARTIIVERIAAGMQVCCSIGYQVIEEEYRKDGTRMLKSLRLYEGSFVLNPANPLASVVSAKSLLAEGMALADNVTLVLAANEQLTTRMESIAAIRKKEGRRLSQATVSTIQSLRQSAMDIVEQMNALLSESDDVADEKKDAQGAPNEQSDSMALTRAKAQYALLQAEFILNEIQQQ
jgi:HK97 family phage prohead protease